MTPFAPLFVPEELLEAVSGRAWLEAMLEVEAALARAEAAAGIVSPESAAAVAGACRAELYDLSELLRQGRSAGNPAEPLVRALRREVGGEAAADVHRGATSQDVLDTASMLVARRALDLVLAELDRVEDALAALAEKHRSTPMAGRTLLQHAVPTTLGLKAAGWLVALLETRARLETIRARRLAAQLGGAAGTLAVLGEQGPEVLARFAQELGLVEPAVPWHTDRTRVAELGGALETTAGVLAKVALDLVLLAQTEVGEVREGPGGGSSTMPHKRNPARSALARACASLVGGYASVLTRALVQEHERAAGAWQAEWDALSGALAYTGGAAWAVADALAELEVDAERMRANLELTGGLVLSERVAYALGGGEAHGVVREAAARAGESGRTFADELRADARVDLSEERLAELLDPGSYLGSAEAFVDRALARLHSARSERA
jgi:3-carboxy-cis,cis-muconate cycloisomerase